MNQYRCTRPEVYEEGCPGHTEPGARQGHYIDALTEEEALMRMKQWFPAESWFDIQLWKQDRRRV